MIEEHFRRRDTTLRVVVATTTLAMGVNTPASAAVIVGLEHPGPSPYSVAEYKNLVGRAGRLGYAERGASFLIATSPHEEHQDWQQYVAARPEDLVFKIVSRGAPLRYKTGHSKTGRFCAFSAHEGAKHHALRTRDANLTSRPVPLAGNSARSDGRLLTSGYCLDVPSANRERGLTA